MEPFDQELAAKVDHYIEQLFNPHDEALAQNLQNAQAAELPIINVSPNEGKLLYLLAKMAGAKRALEIGTLGGYSTTWLARALPADGKVVTLELDQKHAEVARKNLARAGVADRVEVRVGRAVDSLLDMIKQHAVPFDLIFIDADKVSYVEYLDLSLQLSHPGTVILADNVLRNGRVMDRPPADESARGAKAFNDALAAHPRLESIILPIIRANLDGLSISIVK
ncbi:caffeoyl-CoA O-methyltransferase [Thermoflexales bacterium]|nr:caffeoyl-CoA O-methyltransferase [Thermoflexales bacterium]